MSNQPDPANRLKGIRIPEEICVKYERAAGVKPWQIPTRAQAQDVSRMMVTALSLGVQGIKLSAEDHAQILETIRNNEARIAHQLVKGGKNGKKNLS